MQTYNLEVLTTLVTDDEVNIKTKVKLIFAKNIYLITELVAKLSDKTFVISWWTISMGRHSVLYIHSTIRSVT